MSDEIVFGTESLMEGLEPFAGTVEFAQFNCKCEHCQKGKVSLAEMGAKVPEKTRLHIRIRPDEDAPYEGKQNFWCTVSKAKNSGWGKLNRKFEELGIVENLQKEGIMWLEGKRFIFQQETYNPGFGNQEKSDWFPTELLEG